MPSSIFTTPNIFTIQICSNSLDLNEVSHLIKITSVTSFFRTKSGFIEYNAQYKTVTMNDNGREVDDHRTELFALDTILKLLNISMTKANFVAS